MNLSKALQCFVVNKNSDGKIIAEVQEQPSPSRSNGGVIVDLEYSAVNYKDALAATGHPGVALTLPLVPGIDAVGKVTQSDAAGPGAGQTVVIAHADFGTRRDGGWCQQTQVPADWCVPLPNGLSPLEAIVLGTAGYTAAQCVESLIHHGVSPETGPVVVTGATGGVGIMAVKLLHKLGYQAVASTGKTDQHDWLKECGAAQVIDRSELVDDSKKPLLSARWAGAVDTVGGETLVNVIRGTQPRGCVTACGLVGGAEMNATVYPFILRGVALQGIDSAGQTQQERIRLWNRLGGEWKLPDLDALAHHAPLSEVQSSVDRVLAGKACGREIVVL